MKKLIICLLFLTAGSTHAYMGYRSTEAKMSFSATLDVDGRKPTENQAREKITDQLQYLYGPMGLSKVKAAPTGSAEEEKITRLKINPREGGGWRIEYRYTGIIVLESGPRDFYEIYLPTAAAEDESSPFYTDGFRARRGQSLNVCTDEHYQSFDDYWYFWGPKEMEDRKSCPLEKGQHYQAIRAEIQRIPNTTNTRPDYEKMADKDGKIHISLLMGLDDPSASRTEVQWNPFRSADLNAENYIKIRQLLVKELGIGTEQHVPWSKEQIAKVVPVRLAILPYVEELSRVYNRQGGKTYEIVVRLFFAPTGMDEDSTAFHFFLKDAIKNSTLMIYDGHSGLGGNLDLEQIEEALKRFRQRQPRLREIEKKHGFKLNPEKGKYQIYFFNSCSSYSYYNEMFFDRKKEAGRGKDADQRGTKFLDILTTGLETPFDGAAKANYYLIRAIHTWAYNGTDTGYKTIMQRLNMENLIGVNGDEDNPLTTDK